MPNLRSLKPLLLLAVGFLAAPACSLDPPPYNSANVGGASGSVACNTGAGNDSVDGGESSGVDSGESNIDNIVTPVACSASNSDLTSFKYAPGYTQDKGLLAQVQTTINGMSLADEAAQMRGVSYGTAFSVQYNSIQKSEDTVESKIRGFRYRDASRGMNLGEDMEGALPNAATVDGAQVGYSTAFPVSMARGAAFDLDLEYAIGEAIGDEMQAAKQTLLLAPCMNLLRHPLWGRAQETYGEDPFHLGRLASAMTVGVQQHIAADAKHFMAYDIENLRAANNSDMDEQTLREIYGRHFRMVVQDGGVASVMASYNKVNGTKSTQDPHTLTEVLRNDFGFKGFILSDWWAMPNTTPNIDPSILKSTAVEAVKAGLDVELPWALNFGQLESIVNSKGGLLKKDIDAAAARVLEQKFRFKADNLTGAVGLGTPKTVYSNYRISCDADHIALSQKAALESMVLLKNDNSTLPIPSSVTKVAVLGATVGYTTGGRDKTVNFATDVVTGDLGSSRVFPDPAKSVGPFAGIKATAPGSVNVVNPSSADDYDAKSADFIVVMAGLTAEDEGEEYTGAGDRVSLALDAKQQKRPQYQNIQNNLIAAAAKLGKPMVVVLEGASVIDMSPWLSSVQAVVMAFYPGQVGGTALGQLLWGQANFSGKLPFTWGKSLDDYETFNGGGTTSFDYYVGYSYFDHASKVPQYPFGYGLSYTSFEYRKLQLGCSDMSKGAILPVVVNVANIGNVAGDEIVMVFVSFPNTSARRPFKELKGFARVRLNAGEEKQITIPVRLADLDYFQTDSANQSTGKWVVESGDIKIMVGGRSTILPLSGTVKVNGY
jgi:beta-glucosidase